MLKFETKLDTIVPESVYAYPELQLRQASNGQVVFNNEHYF